MLPSGTGPEQPNLIFLVANYLEILKHTSAGKDGLHNLWYKFGGAFVLYFLVRLTDSYFSGDVLPADINEGLFAFLPKNDKEYDKELSKEGIFTCPLDLRPLTLKNADNKIAAGIINWVIILYII